MNILRGRFGKAAKQSSVDDKYPRLVVKTRCLLVADVVAINADGKRETVASGLNEAAAREVFMAMTGRPWTRTETEH
jgi:hypothetical protein